jgi:hypothetical protein
MVGLLVLLPAAALAAPVQQSFISTAQLQDGELVSLSANPQTVEPATSHNVASLVGVVAPAAVSPFEVNDAQQTSITTNGLATALVSDVGGDIRVGDPIAISPIAGVGAKPTVSGRILGTAQASFNAKTSGAAKVNVTDTTGKKRSVEVGRIPVLVNVTYYVAPPSTQKVPALPPFLLRLASTLAGKQVSPVPLIISFVLVVATLVIAGVLLNSAIRSSIIAVGRNPLSKSLLQRNMIQVLLMAAAVIGGGLVAALAILRLF